MVSLFTNRWWEVPLHDKALLEGICKHGIGRHDLMITDKELPFHQVVQNNIEKSEINDPNLENTASMLIRIAWPKELVIQRRIDALCELILRPKQPQKRQIRNRKRKTTDTDATASTSSPSAASRVSNFPSSSNTPPPHVANRQYLSDVATDSDEDDGGEDDDEDNANSLKRARYEMSSQPVRRVPTKPLKSQGVRQIPPSMMAGSAQHYSAASSAARIPVASVATTPSTSLNEDEEMEEGEISSSDDDGNLSDHRYMRGSF